MGSEAQLEVATKAHEPASKETSLSYHHMDIYQMNKVSDSEIR